MAARARRLSSIGPGIGCPPLVLWKPADSAARQESQRGGDGMAFKTVESPYSVDHTVGRLIDSLFRRGITVFARIDHASNARLAGLELADEQVLIFGDPRAGTVLMQADPRVGFELPLRMVVWRKDGVTHVGYEEPEGLGTPTILPVWRRPGSHGRPARQARCGGDDGPRGASSPGRPEATIAGGGAAAPHGTRRSGASCRRQRAGLERGERPGVAAGRREDGDPQHAGAAADEQDGRTRGRGRRRKGPSRSA